MYSPSSTRAGLLHNHPVQLFTGDAGFLYQGNGITRWEKQWTENAFWKQDPQLKLKQKSSLTQCFSQYRFPFQTCFVLAYCPFVHPVHPSFIYFCAGVVMYNLKIQNKTKKTPSRMKLLDHLWIDVLIALRQMDELQLDWSWCISHLPAQPNLSTFMPGLVLTVCAEGSDLISFCPLES